MLDKNQWLAIGLLSGFAYILGKDRESFEAEYTLTEMANKNFRDIDKISGFVADRLNHTQESWANLTLLERKGALNKIREDEDLDYLYDGGFDDGETIILTKKQLKKYLDKNYSSEDNIEIDDGYIAKHKNVWDIEYLVVKELDYDEEGYLKDAESFEALDDSSLCVICKENEATEGRYETIVCEDCAYGTASNPGWSNWRRTNHEDRCPSCNNEEELWVGDWMRCSKCNDSFCENCETDGQTLCEQCFENKDAESFEAENLFNSQKENMTLVALGRAHQEILNGGERATMEIWFEGRPVMFAIDNAAGYFAINPRVLQSRYDSHNFVEPEWRDEYHQALSALKEAFPTWSMFSPKLEKSFDL